MIWWPLWRCLTFAEWNWSLLGFFWVGTTLCSFRFHYKNVHKAERKNRTGKKCEIVPRIFEEWITSRSENCSTLGQRMQKVEKISPFFLQLLSIWRHVIVQTWMWESDDLRESKWQGDSTELERPRQRKMRKRRVVKRKKGRMNHGRLFQSLSFCFFCWNRDIHHIFSVMQDQKKLEKWNIPLCTSDGLCGEAESHWCIWQLKGSCWTDCTNDLTLLFQPTRTSCSGHPHTLSFRLICFPGV